MGQVPMIAAWAEAAPYLRNLSATVVADVQPLLSLPGHAPFAVCREALSYVDHLGHLYSGRGQVGDRSREYLRKVMAIVDVNYATRCGEIYQMFRCGTVHEFEPKVLENRQGDLLLWLCYHGKRIDAVDVDGARGAVTHLTPIRSSTPNRYYLPVSTTCLVEDLVASIEAFVQGGPENERITAWNRAARELSTPEAFEFSP
jgi:hypothetical protein